MDWQLKTILDKYFPYTPEESTFGQESVDKRKAKFELRKRVATVVYEYLETKKDHPELPSLNLDEIMKKLSKEN